MTTKKSTWGGPNRNQGRKVTKLRIGRHSIDVGQQVLCREVYPDGVTPGKVGVIAIEDSNKDGDYTIKVCFNDCSWVIGVYKE